MRAAVLALVLLLAPSVLPSTQADVNLVRVVAVDTLLEGGEWTFRDYIVVAPGATLTIRDATVWLDAARLCAVRPNIPVYRCQPQLEVHGALVLDNATLDTHLWTPTVDAGYILSIERGVAHIRGSELRHYQHVTFLQAGSEASVIEDSVFRDAVGPVRFMQGASGVFRGNLVEDVREGVYASDATVTIEHNRVRNVNRSLGVPAFNWGIAAVSASPNDHVWPADVTIRGNVVENANVGIVSQTGRASLVEDNVVRFARAGMILGFPQDGLVLDRQPLTLRRNAVDNATEGIRILGAATTGPQNVNTTESVRLGDNVLTDIACNGVRIMPMPNGVRVDVDATGIWWGSGEGPTDADEACTAIRNDDDLSTIDASNWLRAPPTWSVRLLPVLKE